MLFTNVIVNITISSRSFVFSQSRVDNCARKTSSGSRIAVEILHVEANRLVLVPSRYNERVFSLKKTRREPKVSEGKQPAVQGSETKGPWRQRRDPGQKEFLVQPANCSCCISHRPLKKSVQIEKLSLVNWWKACAEKTYTRVHL